MLLNDQKSKFISEQYTKIGKSWTNPEIDIINLKDSIDNLWNCLMTIWESDHAYNEKRLHKIVNVFG
jgi:hypothetical protein